MSDLEMRYGGKEEIFAMCDALREAAIPFIAADAASIDPNRIAMMHAAAAVFSGILFGELIAMGDASDQDKRRAADGVAKNFRIGIDIGKRHTLRVAEMLAGGAGTA